MKKIISIVTLIFITTILFGQIDLHERQNNVFNKQNLLQENEFVIMQEPISDEKRQNRFEMKNVKGTIWVQDSTYYYESEGTEWNVDWREKVLNRDQYGNMTNAIRHSYNSEPEIWTNKDTITAIYHNANTTHKYLEIKWNTDEQQWENDTTYYKEYDENENLLVRIINEGYWDNYKYIYTFENENLIEELHLWNINGWKNSSKRLYTYDNNGNLIQDIIQDWNNDTEEWINEWQHLYTYDNNEIQQITNEWNSDTEEWIVRWKSIDTYDNNGNLTQELMIDWNNNTEEWINWYQHLYTYNSNGNQTQNLYQNWNNSSEEWKSIYQYLYIYDNNENQIQELKQSWNSSSEEWINNNQTLYTYDENGNQTQELKQNWNSDTGEWNNGFKYDYFWSELEVVNITEINNNKIIVYPNPASDKIQFSSSVLLDNSIIEIYTISGKLVNNISANNNNEIDISNLSKGIYIIKISSETVNFVEKFIKE